MEASAKTGRVNVRLPPDLDATLRRLADDEDRSVSDTLRRLLREALEARKR